MKKGLAEKISARKKDIFLYLALLVLMLLFCRASVMKTIHPFGFAFAFSLILLQKNAFFITLFYFLGSNLITLSLEGLIINVVSCSFMLLLFLFFKIIKKPITLVPTFIFAMLSQAGYVYFHISSVSEIFVSVAMIVVAIMFIYVCTQTLSAIFMRGFFSRFTLDESVCGAIFLVALFSGLYDLSIYSFSFTDGIVVLLLLVLSRIINRSQIVYLSALVGFGMAFASANAISIAVFVSFGVLASAFSNQNKFFAPILILCLHALFGLFFNVFAAYSYISLLPVLLAAIIYLCLPSKFFRFVKGYCYNYEGSLANEFLLSGKNDVLKRKLEKTSELFKNMQVAYRNLSVGEFDKSEAARALASDLMLRFCKGCLKCDECGENIKSAIEQLYSFALEKGKVSLIDANNLITTTCVSLGALIEEVNQSAKEYFEFEKAVKTQNTGKMLLSEQLGSTGDILKEMVEAFNRGESVNEKFSKELLDEFTLCQIVASEVLVLESESGVERVIAIVRSTDALSSKLSSCVKSVLKLDFSVALRQMTRLAGWSVVCFVPSPKYQVQIGFSGRAEGENKISGDTYSFQKLPNGRVLVALADGMGHGKRANQISTTALNLIESFYKSGFSSQMIISSVNKLLLPSANDSFACLDACIIDTMLGTADFVKIGASVSVIKSESTAKLVEAENLPLGIVQSLEAREQKLILKDQDVVVLASDGVVDSFASPEEFLNYVNNERVINVQMLADSILEEALSRANPHDDDMSVITIKLSAVQR